MLEINDTNGSNDSNCRSILEASSSGEKAERLPEEWRHPSDVFVDISWGWSDNASLGDEALGDEVHLFI
jgi:hypothetical protein